METSICRYKNGKYSASIMDDSAIACDKIIEETKTVPTNFKQPVKHKISVFYLDFYYLVKHYLYLLVFTVT